MLSMVGPRMVLRRGAAGGRTAAWRSENEAGGMELDEEVGREPAAFSLPGRGRLNRNSAHVTPVLCVQTDPQIPGVCLVRAGASRVRGDA